jgi:hypothetical protein
MKPVKEYEVWDININSYKKGGSYMAIRADANLLILQD